MSRSPEWLARFDDGLMSFKADITTLLESPSVPIASADVPSTSGVYAFEYYGAIKYIGEARGRGGLRDRILSKHVSGDDGHTLQRHFLSRFPDRVERRSYISERV